MLANKILRGIVTVSAFVVFPVQLVTTFILGLLVQITFGLLLIPLSIPWVILFWGPLIGLSFVYEKVFILRPIVVIVGIPIAVLGNIYVALVPSMGEMESRYSKLLYCQTFPYTWRFHKYLLKKITLSENDTLKKVFLNISTDRALGQFLEKIESGN